MRKHLSYALASALVAGGLVAQTAPAQQEQRPQRQTRQQQQQDQRIRPQQERRQQQQQRRQQQANGDVDGIVLLLVQPTVLPAGITRTRTVDAEGIRETLEEVTESAMERGGFEEIVDQLVDADRNRIGEYEPDNFRILDGRIAQLQNAWRDRYGAEFDVDDDVVFGAGFENFAIAPGVITNPSLVERAWPVDPTPFQQGMGAVQASRRGIPRGVDDIEDWRDQTNIDEGRQVAVVYIPAEHGLPAMYVSMIDEAFGWKIDVPRGIEGDVLHRNLLNHLTKVGENVEQWPNSPTEAKRFIAHHVLMALYGVPAYDQDQQQQQQQQQQQRRGQQQRQQREMARTGDQRQQFEQGQQQQQQQQRPDVNVRPRATRVSPEQNRRAIFQTMAAATETALMRGGYDGFIQLLADQDQQRAAKYDKQDVQQVNQLVRKLQDQWWEKYGKEFTVNNERMTYGNQVSVVQGDIRRIANMSNLPASAERVANRISQDVTREEADNQYALVTFPAANGLQETAIPLVNAEYVGWRIDLPDDIDGQQLHQNLVNQLRQLADNAQQWPEEEQAAYRYFTHSILSAAVKSGQQQQRQQGQQQQQQRQEQQQQ